jgi:hypothetical protein
MDYAVYKTPERRGAIPVPPIQQESPNNTYGAVVIYVEIG